MHLNKIIQVEHSYFSALNNLIFTKKLLAVGKDRTGVADNALYNEMKNYFHFRGEVGT